MVLAPSDFRDAEHIVPHAIWTQQGIEVDTSSTEILSTGRFGYEVHHDFTLDEASATDYDGIFFVGGGGSLDFMENETTKNLTLEFINSDKATGAICAAPRNFLNWGILNGKKATGHNWDGNFPNLCKESGAAYMNNSVVVDGKILTADGPEAAEEAAFKFLEIL